MKLIRTPKILISFLFYENPLFQVNGLLNDDIIDLTILYQSNRVPVENPINASEYEASIASFSNENYYISQNLSTLFEISKKELTVNWGNNLTFVYNSQVQKPTPQVNGLLNDDIIDLIILYQSNGVPIESPINAGEYEASIASFSNENYYINQNLIREFSINPQNITINAVNEESKYSENIKSIVNNYEIIGTIFEVNCIDITVTTNDVEHVPGTYTITINVICENSNYSFTINNGTYIVLNGITVNYVLPNKETTVYYVDCGSEMPNINEIYQAPYGSYLFSRTIYQDDNTITYELYNVNLFVVSVISAIIILMFLLTVAKLLKKKRYI